MKLFYIAKVSVFYIWETLGNTGAIALNKTLEHFRVYNEKQLKNKGVEIVKISIREVS